MRESKSASFNRLMCLAFLSIATSKIDRQHNKKFREKRFHVNVKSNNISTSFQNRKKNYSNSAPYQINKSDLVISAHKSIAL